MPIRLPGLSWPPRLRRHVDELAGRPIARLTRHFLNRLVHGESESEMGIGILLGLLAAPGAFQSLILLDKYSTLLIWLRHRHTNAYVASAPEKYLFISVAMAITGIVTVLKWDRILPDAQDYLNLAPLPIRPHTVLLANAAAILIAVGVLAVDINAASMILFPLFVSASAQTGAAAFLRFAGIHAVCLVMASLFTFCAVFALFGLVAAVLPREMFRSASAWLRGAMLVAFIMLVLSGFAFPGSMQALMGLGWVPSFWFLGLYQSLQNAGNPQLEPLGHRALLGSAAAPLVMLAAYALSYRKRFASVLEGGRRASTRLFAAVLWPLDLFGYRASGFDQASYRFVVRALLRNETHRLCLAVSFGLGWVLALQSGSVAMGGLIAAYLLILGLWLAFALPAMEQANWIFRSVLDAHSADTHSLARRVMLGFLVPGVLVPTFVWSAYRGGLGAAVLQSLCLLACALCLIEVLLAGYRKIPLTCPMPGFHDRLPMVCLLQFLGFKLFTEAGARLEAWISEYPARFLLVPAAMAAAWVWNQKRLRDASEAGELETGISFESAPRPAIERLHLSDAE
jgi:hypothetical protein